MRPREQAMTVGYAATEIGKGCFWRAASREADRHAASISWQRGARHSVRQVGAGTPMARAAWLGERSQTVKGVPACSHPMRHTFGSAGSSSHAGLRPRDHHTRRARCRRTQLPGAVGRWTSYPSRRACSETIRAWFRPTPKTLTPEDVETAAQAERMRYEEESIRLSLRSGASENYQSGRVSSPSLGDSVGASLGPRRAAATGLGRAPRSSARERQRSSCRRAQGGSSSSPPLVRE
jgi:hypothetical protein